MIRLAGSSTYIWKSIVYSHPAIIGSSYVTYTFNHNRGAKPDLIETYQDGTDHRLTDFWENAVGSSYFNKGGDEHTDLNTSFCKVYRINSVTEDIYFKLFFFS